MSVFATALGDFALQRLPVIEKGGLRAWDAADALLLQQVADEFPQVAGLRVLLVNDAFGALAVGLHTAQLQSWSDSWLAHQATRQNLAANGLAEEQVVYLPSIEEPAGALDLVLIKIPKTLALLEDQLWRLKPHLSTQTRIIGAGMVRHIHTSTLKLFERILGTTTTSLARKKARLIFSRLEQPECLPSPYPTQFEVPEWGLELSNHANVFAREKLDIGARFMLQQFSRLPAAEQVVDLGCGNGVLGIVARRQLPHSRLLFLDESYMAVASARTNYQRLFAKQSADFRVSHVLQDSGLSPGSVDLILCNPPFHQQHVIGDYLAWEMFKQSRRFLRRGGVLWVVGNRHLQYHAKLKRLFGQCRQLASHRKFVVLEARRC